MARITGGCLLHSDAASDEACITCITKAEQYVEHPAAHGKDCAPCGVASMIAAHPLHPAAAVDGGCVLARLCGLWRRVVGG